MMTFNDIARKMFRANFRRYLLFFLCSCFTIMIFFAFAIMFTNDTFMKGYKVDSSSNIIAPSIFLAIFSVFFIIYAQTAFVKSRKSDFGMFMVLGMTNMDIAKIILIENSLIGGGALIVGMLSGTFFSKLLSFILSLIIDLKGIRFGVSYKSIMYTVVLFGSIYLTSTLINLIASTKYEILYLLKENNYKDKNRLQNKLFVMLSVVLMAAGIVDGVININVNNEAAIFQSLLCLFLGVYIFISNLGLILNRLLRKTKKCYFKNLMFLTNFDYTLGQAKKVMFIIVILVNITIFFSNLALGFGKGARYSAMSHAPYDIAYSEIYGTNKISEEKLNQILSDGQTLLIDRKNVSFISDKHIFIFSDAELNQKLNTDFHVSHGKFINLFNEDLGDGYKHSLNEMSAYTLETQRVSVKFQSQGKFIGVIFNNILSAYNYIILNHEDYNMVKSSLNASCLGEMKLFSFKDWTKTSGIVDNLTKELQKYNEENNKTVYGNVEIDRFMLKPSSRMELYNEGISQGRTLLFYQAFVSVLFFASAGIILHFKLMTELEREKKKYKKLYKIGITEGEIEKIVYKELLLLFFLPQVLGIIIASVYSYIMPAASKLGLFQCLCACGLGIVYLVFQLVFFVLYKRLYVKKIYSIA